MHGIASATSALAILAVLSGFVGVGEARAQGGLTLTSPAFPDGGEIPLDYVCPDEGGQEMPPPLTWSAPPGAGGLALVMEDLNAGPFVHWIVYGMHPGPGGSAAGTAQPGYGLLAANGNGDRAYRGPCPGPGTGTHLYLFTLYQVPSDIELPVASEGEEFVLALARAATDQAQWTGTFTAAPAANG